MFCDLVFLDLFYGKLLGIKVFLVVKVSGWIVLEVLIVFEENVF